MTVGIGHQHVAKPGDRLGGDTHRGRCHSVDGVSQEMFEQLGEWGAEASVECRGDESCPRGLLEGASQTGQCALVADGKAEEDGPYQGRRVDLAMPYESPRCAGAFADAPSW